MSNLTSKQIEDYVEEYVRLQKAYELIMKVAKKRLKIILRENGIKYLKVQARTKEIASLKKKLEKTKKASLKNSVTEMSDLIGCRVILYHDFDINVLAEHIQRKTEFHDIEIEQKYSRKGYNGLHIDISLKNQSSICPDIEATQKLKCEVQITTAVYHAWSESSHQYFYKSGEYETGQDQNYHNELKKLFEKEAEEGIKMQLEIDGIAKLWHEFQDGIEVISNDYLNKIEEMQSNNEISVEMNTLSHHIKILGNRDPERISLVNHLQRIVRQSQYNFDNNDYEEEAYLRSIHRSCIEILAQLIYRNTELIPALDELFFLAQHSNETIRDEAERILLSVIQYQTDDHSKWINLDRQIYISKKISSLPREDLVSGTLLIARLCEELFSGSFETIEAINRRNLKWGIGLLPADEEIKNIRDRAIQSLVQVFHSTRLNTFKKQVMESLSMALFPQSLAPPTLEWMEIIIESANSIFTFYKTEINDAEYDLLFLVDEQICGLKQLYGREPFAFIEEIELCLTQNISYQIYKACFKSEMRIDLEFSPDHEGEMIKTELAQYAEAINSDNQNIYLNIINYMSNEYSSDKGQGKDYQYLYYFIEKIAALQPELAEQLITKNYAAPFNDLILRTMWKNGRENYANKTIHGWIDKSQNLIQCINFLSDTEIIDDEMLEQVYKKSKNSDEEECILLHLLIFIGRSYKDNKVGKEIAKQCIKDLSSKGNGNWLIDLSHPLHISLLVDFEKSDWLDILDCLVTLQDFHRMKASGEYILTLLSQKQPKIFIQLFQKRMDYNNSLESNSDLYKLYHPVSFYLQRLHALPPENINALSHEYFLNLEQIISERSESSLPEMYQYRDFFINTFSPDIESVLIPYIKSRREDVNFPFLFLIMGYSGYFKAAHNIAKELLQYVPKEKIDAQELIKVLSGSILSNVARGVNGRVKIIKKVKNQIQSWREDNNELVRQFAEIYIAHLEGWVVTESKIADKFSHDFYGELTNENDCEHNQDCECEKDN